MPFSYEAPVVVITISKHVRTNHPDSSTYSELYQLSTEFPRPLKAVTPVEYAALQSYLPYKFHYYGHSFANTYPELLYLLPL